MYNLGILLSLIAVAFHAGNIIIAGRGAVLCSDPDTEIDLRRLNYFHAVLVVCEHLHLHGTIFFVIAVFETSFLLFAHYVYPGIFCGLSVVGVALYLTGKYREVSLMYRDIMRVVNFIRGHFPGRLKKATIG